MALEQHLEIQRFECASTMMITIEEAQLYFCLLGRGQGYHQEVSEQNCGTS